MIDPYIIDNNDLIESTLHSINEDTLTWIDCFSPTKDELKKISSLTLLPEEDLAECLDTHERPRINEFENYSLIVYRVPYMFKKRIITTPVFIIISKIKKTIITIRHKELNSFDKIKTKIKNKTIQINNRGFAYLVFRLMDEGINEFFSIINDVTGKIDKIEKAIMNHPEKKILHEIHDSKKTLIIFNKDLTGAREVIAGIEKDYVKNIDRKTLKHFRIVYNDIVQLIDMISTYRDILTGTMDIYMSSISNNMNAVMKTLTLISAFVLIPTLISGIYGMNFSRSGYNMPELGWKYGYIFSLGLMLLSIIVMYIWFRKKRWV